MLSAHTHPEIGMLFEGTVCVEMEVTTPLRHTRFRLAFE